MYARVVLDIATDFLEGIDSLTDSREQFWSVYNSIAGRRDSRPQANEERLRERYASVLEGHLNDALGTGGLFPVPAYAPQRVRKLFRKVTVRLVDVDYGSLDLLLEILGVDNKTIANGFWELLAFYCPLALNDTFGAHVPLTSHVRSPTPEVAAAAVVSRWDIARTSLFVPVLLALAVGWYGFEAMKDRVRVTDEERKAFREEHLKLLTAAMAQNEKLSAAVMGRISDAKAWEEFQQAAVKQILSLIPPPNSAPVAKVPTDNKP